MASDWNFLDDLRSVGVFRVQPQYQNADLIDLWLYDHSFFWIYKIDHTMKTLKTPFDLWLWLIPFPSISLAAQLITVQVLSECLLEYYLRH